MNKNTTNFDLKNKLNNISCSLREVECFLEKSKTLIATGKIGLLLKSLLNNRH